jgi:predicted dehydrogenase
MTPLKIGVLGVGSMGKNHLRVLSTMTEYNLIGCFDVNSQACYEQAEKYQIKAFDSETELYKAVDVVHIVTPSYLHSQQAVAAARAGCHIMVEKPIALTLDQADAIITACSEAEVKLCVGHVERYNPAIMTLTDMLAGQNVIAFSFERLSPRVMRIADTSVIEDLMIHDIDVLLSLVKQPIQEITSHGVIVYSDNLDYAQALISFKNGVIASLTASRVTEAKVRAATVTTDDSYICLDYLQRTIQVFRKSNITLDPGFTAQYAIESLMQTISVPINEPLRLEFEHFANCILRHEPVKTSGEMARHALAICMEIQEKALNRIGVNDV